MDLEKQYITIKTLDNFPRVLFWSIDEFLCLAVPFFMGICFGLIYLIPIGFILKSIYTKIKKKMPRGALSHRFYWMFPKEALVRFGLIKNIPPSHYKELIL